MTEAIVCCSLWRQKQTASGFLMFTFRPVEGDREALHCPILPSRKSIAELPAPQLSLSTSSSGLFFSLRPPPASAPQWALLSSCLYAPSPLFAIHRLHCRTSGPFRGVNRPHPPLHHLDQRTATCGPPWTTAAKRRRPCSSWPTPTRRSKRPAPFSAECSGKWPPCALRVTARRACVYVCGTAVKCCFMRHVLPHVTPIISGRSFRF